MPAIAQIVPSCLSNVTLSSPLKLKQNKPPVLVTWICDVRLALPSESKPKRLLPHEHIFFLLFQMTFDVAATQRALEKRMCG
jgi:hypothetical protein